MNKDKLKSAVEVAKRQTFSTNTPSEVLESHLTLISNAELMLKVSDGVPEEKELVKNEGHFSVTNLHRRGYNQGRAETLAGVCNRLEGLEETISKLYKFPLTEEDKDYVKKIATAIKSHILGEGE